MPEPAAIYLPVAVLYTHNSPRMNVPALMNLQLIDVKIVLVPRPRLADRSRSRRLVVHKSLQIPPLQLESHLTLRVACAVEPGALVLCLRNRLPALPVLLPLARSPRTEAVRAAKHALEEWSQGGQARGCDAHVHFCCGPDGDVARVPKEVAFLAVVGQIGDFDGCGGASEEAQAQNAHQSHSRAQVDVQVPEHGQWDDQGK